MKHWLRIAFLALFCGFAGGVPFHAATPEDLDAAAARLAQAGRALDELRDGEVGPVELADGISIYDRSLSQVRSVVLQAGALENEVRLQILRESADMSTFLAMLESLSLGRARPLGLHPEGPLGAARARMMVGAILPAISDQADEVKARLDAIALAGRQQEEGLALLEDGLAKLASARAELVDQLQFREEYRIPADHRLTEALSSAESLADLTAELDPSSSGRTVADTEREARLWPVDKSVLRAFNERDAAGVLWPGIVLSAAPSSLVRAPGDATVRYAGPFLDYRGIIVLETGASELVILANLAELIVSTGERIEKGAPLGVLGGRSPGVEEYVKIPDLETGAGLREALYIEVRDRGGPIDPVAWFDGKNG